VVESKIMASSQDDIAGLLTQVLEDIKTIKSENARLNTQLDSINGKVNILSSVKQINESAERCKFVSRRVFIYIL
jgi:predicted nuclease with TOPRIM domain